MTASVFGFALVILSLLFSAFLLLWVRWIINKIEKFNYGNVSDMKRVLRHARKK